MATVCACARPWIPDPGMWSQFEVRWAHSCRSSRHRRHECADRLAIHVQAAANSCCDRAGLVLAAALAHGEDHGRPRQRAGASPAWSGHRGTDWSDPPEGHGYQDDARSRPDLLLQPELRLHSTAATCQLDVGFISFTNGGTTWSAATRTTARPPRAGGALNVPPPGGLVAPKHSQSTARASRRLTQRRRARTVRDEASLRAP